MAAPPRCCDMHNRHCEPPAELCCDRCSEVDHPFHPPGVGCVWASDADVARAQAIAGLAGRQPATSGEQSTANHWSNAAAPPPSGTYCPSAEAVRRAGAFDRSDTPDPSLTTVLAAARNLARLWRNTDEGTQAQIAIANTYVATALDRLAAVEPFAGLSADPGRVN